jgi:DNA polymerase/3'-5' exonuclease PolX
MTKARFPRQTALAVAREILAELRPVCEPERIIVAGSLRRLKAEVGDLEILYIGRRETRKVPGDLFRTAEVCLADLAIREMIASGTLALRQGEGGHTACGNMNKLLVHCATGLPVDLFATIETSWFNYLVCRTGSKENNMRIATAAQAKGLRWHPYGSGFSDRNGRALEVKRERDVFDLVGLPYLEPKDR